MRSAVTLDPDVERLIHEAMKERGMSFKQALNDAARIGLSGKVPMRARKFTQKAFRMRDGQAHNSTWLVPEPPAVGTAFDLTASWLAHRLRQSHIPVPRHLQILGDLLRPLGSGGNLASDAHLAALAIEHRAELSSSDGDFARFSGLKWRNPLS
jgi:predicted nucleic acid-binding protein